MDLERGRVVEERLPTVGDAKAEADLALKRNPGGRFRIEVRDGPDAPWSTVFTLSGFP
jgi:hypothetical protein